MRKVIGIGISLLFFVCIAAQASSQNIHCWDLNENYDCDLETEDMNNDGRCNKRDCPHEPEPVGGVQVYDADGQYLGILSLHVAHGLATFTCGSYNGPRLLKGTEIFIPVLERFAVIGPCAGDIPRTNLFFTTADCTGTAYLEDFVTSRDGILRVDGIFPEYRYFKSMGALQEIESRSYLAYGVCNSDNANRLVSTAVEILETDIPFSLPVALPLEYRSE